MEGTVTTQQAMAWASTPYVRKMEENQAERERLHCDALVALRLEVLRLSIVNGANSEALDAYRAARV
jgi:hypothetical protein